MKLDQALKLYIGLYCVCFMFSWLVSIPMILHVSRDGECLLFVTPYITYGPAAGKLQLLNIIEERQAKTIKSVLSIFSLDHVLNHYRLLGLRFGIYCRRSGRCHLIRSSHHAAYVVEKVFTPTWTPQLQRLSFSTDQNLLANGKNRIFIKKEISELNQIKREIEKVFQYSTS